MGLNIEGTVTNPTEPPTGPVQFAKGDVVWQTKHAPDGYRFKVLEDRGGVVIAQPLDPKTRKKVGDPVELLSATIALAED